jgi:hypothetical protein
MKPEPRGEARRCHKKATNGRSGGEGAPGIEPETTIKDRSCTMPPGHLLKFIEKSTGLKIEIKLRPILKAKERCYCAL